MRALVLLSALPLVFTATACDGAGDDPIITPGPTDSFELVYVSGHLGNYWDCPQDALSPSGGEKGAPEPASSAEAADMAPCIGDDCVPIVLNCEHAEVTLRIHNTGQEALSGLALAGIRLVGADAADVVESSLVELIRTDGKSLSDPIEAGAEIDVVVRFHGLQYGDYDGLFGDANGDAGPMSPKVSVELDFETPNFSDTLTTPALSMLPSVAT